MRLSENAMNHMIDAEIERLEQDGTDPQVALAYVKVAPLLAEKKAIAHYAAKYPEIRSALPEVLSANEAVIFGAQEYALDLAGRDALRTLLTGDSGQNRARRGQDRRSMR